MPMKEILHRLQPIQVYIVLVLSIAYFVVQMFISQESQSITLLVASYHMLCNIIALSGCIITIKHDDQKTKRQSKSSHESSESFAEMNAEEQQQKEIVAKKVSDKEKVSEQQNEKALKNTFGWARVDVLTMVIVCTFMTSLCFSVVVEVIQTLFHIGHKDHLSHKSEFHSYPYETCIVLGALGLVLNGITYLLIGGYTFHQGSFLHLSADGNVYIVDNVVIDGRKISESKEEPKNVRKSQKLHELSRDVCSIVLVLICSLIIVMLEDKESIEVRLIDPILSLVSIAVLLGLSFPYMKEAGMILLQTIPDCIDIEDFQKRLVDKFSEVDSIHDLHIWQLTQHKYVSTAHVIFQDPSVYRHSINEIVNYFHEQGINIVTIQPEFKQLDAEMSPGGEIRSLVAGTTKDLCLVACRQETCEEKTCCKRNNGSDESIGGKSKSEVQLEQVISVRDVSAEELNNISNYTSVKSLNFPEDTLVPLNKKRSSTSLYNPSNVRNKQKLHKTTSVIEREHQQTPNGSNDIHLIGIKKFVSESIIKNDEHDDVGRNNSQILVENKLLKQLGTTDNNEMEDIYTKCDASNS